MKTTQTKNKPADLNDRENHIKRLVQFNRLSLEAMTVTELKELSAFLIPNKKRLRKSELIDAILEISEPYRLERAAATFATLTVAGEVGLKPELFLKSFGEGLTPQQVSEFVKGHFLSGDYTASSICKTKMKELRTVLENVRMNLPETTPWCNDLYKIVAEFVAPYHQAVNEQYKEKVEEFGTTETIESVIKLDATKLVEWAKKVLEWADTKEDLIKGWHKVSLALAITSGRRMDEIHGTCQFEVVDEKTLRSIGLSKKDSIDTPLESPCLVDANLWKRCIDKMPSERRNRDNGFINSVIRKTIERAVGDIMEFELGLDTYKTSRDFYAAYVGAVIYDRTVNNASLIGFVKRCLGHSSKKSSLSYEKVLLFNLPEKK